MLRRTGPLFSSSHLHYSLLSSSFLHPSHSLIACVDCRQCDGLKTPLMLAAWRRHYKCVEALIAFQANPDLKDMHGVVFVFVCVWGRGGDIHKCVFEYLHSCFVLFVSHRRLTNIGLLGFTAIGHSHKVTLFSPLLLSSSLRVFALQAHAVYAQQDDRMSVKLLWKAKLQHWKQEIRMKKMLRSLNRLAKKSSVSPSTSPRHSPFSSPLHSPKTSPASSPRRGSVVSGCKCLRCRF